MAKSPHEMFAGATIPNDMQAVLDAVEAYESGE
jgi:hypothetical protein